MTARQWIDQLSDTVHDEESKLVVMDGFDDCILGICQRLTDTFVVYDFKKVIAKLQADGMSEEDVREFHSSEHLGVWFGDKTPGFVEMPPRE